MQPLSSFSDTRRRRRRQRLRRFLAAGFAAAALAALGTVAYQIGVAQGRTEAERRERDIAALRQNNRALHERAARADQQAEAAIARAARRQQMLEARIPQGELRRLVELAEARLRAGVPADRLATLLRETRPEQHCAAGLEAQRLVVHTPLATAPVVTASFAGGRILASAEGATAPEGAAPGFDPSEPVTLRFLRIDGEVATAVGRLPLAHAVVLGGEAFQFAVRGTDKPGEILLTAQRCSWP